MRRTIALFIALFAISPLATQSQTRRRTASRSSGSTATAPKSSAVVHAGATRVADQTKNLTRFIFLLGGVAKGIEQTDLVIRRNEASQAVVDQQRRNKETVTTSLRSVREGLDRLEIDFRATPELQRYYIKLAGVAAGAAEAEDLAAANQYDKAGRALLEVVNRLTDVLLEMP